MKRKLFRITAITILLIMIVTVASSFASMLMGVAMVTLGAIIAMTGLFGMLYVPQGVFPDSGSSYATPSGSIGRPVTVQIVDTKDIDPATLQPKVKQQTNTVKIPQKSLADKIKVNDPDYPQLSGALYKDVNHQFDKNNIPALDSTLKDSGALVDGTNTYYKLGDYVRGGNYSRATGPYVSSITRIYDITSGKNCIFVVKDLGYSSGAYRSQQALYVDNGLYTISPPVLREPGDFAVNISGSSGPLTGNQPVTVIGNDELDKFIKANPGSVSIIDGPASAVSDSASPASLPKPATQTGYDAAVAGAQSRAATAQAVASAQGALAAAQASGDPNAIANAQAALDALKAQQAKDDAAAAQQKLADETLDPGTNPDPGAAPKYDTNIDKPDKKDLLSRVTGFISGSPLVNMVKTISITTSSEVSAFSLNYRGRVISFDFSKWQSIYNACGSALVVIAHGYALFIVFRRD